MRFIGAPRLDADDDGFFVSFELSEASDVDVTIVDSEEATVVRHLAAGILGPNAPAPLAPDSLAQRVSWDGNNDLGELVADPEALSARVRVGMCTKLVRLVGDDPYAFISHDMDVNNHTMWQMTGLEAKSDGTVMVMGTAGLMGPITIRQYDANGEYIRTVFPFPAGHPTASVEGWGINVREDGAYTPRHVKSSWPGLTTTSMQHSTWGGSPQMFHNSDPSQLTVRGFKFRSTTFNTDGTIDPDPNTHTEVLVREPVLVDPDVFRDEDNLRGPVFTCMTADESAFYLSGLYKEGSDFYEDGTVWKVDSSTGVATEWFSLGNTVGLGAFSYSTLHGIAIDDRGHVFVADRYNNRVIVLNEDGSFAGDVPIEHPDDIAFNATTGALYVTSRHGTDHSPGDVRLHKITDWETDGSASQEILLTGYRYEYRTQNRSRVTAIDTPGGTNVWVTFKDIPVRIYRDSPDGLTLLRDFYQSGSRQPMLGFNRMVVDRLTETVYVAGGFSSVFRLTDWSAPAFRRVQYNEDTRMGAADLGLDSQRRFLYTRNLDMHPGGRVFRYSLDASYPEPLPVSGSVDSSISGYLWANYHFYSGNSDRGFDVAPNGQVFALSGAERLDFGSKVLMFPVRTSESPESLDHTVLADFGNVAGGIQVDGEGNLYVGHHEPDALERPAGFEESPMYGRTMGRIYKYARTGEGDSLFAEPLGAPERVYETHYGSMYADWGDTGITPRFAVDPFGRLYVPNSMTQTVTVLDNNGGEILHFGTYGNIDSRGGLSGDQVPTDGVPMAWPVSVDATDDYIYVTDLVNVRLLQIQKRFQLDNHPGLTDRLPATSP